MKFIPSHDTEQAMLWYDVFSDAEKAHFIDGYVSKVAVKASTVSFETFILAAYNVARIECYKSRGKRDMWGRPVEK